MDIFRIVGVGFVTAVATIILKQTKPEIAFAATLTGAVLILAFLADEFDEILQSIRTISNASNLEGGLVKTLLKIVGIGYLTEFAAGILNDFGAASVAEKVVLGGKLTILVSALPLIERVISVLGAFLSVL